MALPPRFAAVALLPLGGLDKAACKAAELPLTARVVARPLPTAPTTLVTEPLDEVLAAVFCALPPQLFGL